MNYIKDIFNLNKIIKVMLFVFIPSLLFYIISFFTMKSYGYETMDIIRDFAQIVDVPSVLGLLSTLGTWLWVSSAAISFFAVIAFKHNRENRLLLLLGIFSILLAIDDFFMIHDRYVNEYICYATYAILALALLFYYFKTIIKIDAFSFLLAGILLATSIFIDIIQDDLPFKYSNVQIFEEAFKFVGAAIWLYFSSLVAVFLSKE